MPKIFEYLGIIIMFIRVKYNDDIVQKWIDYFVYHKSIECIKIEGKVK